MYKHNGYKVWVSVKHLLLYKKVTLTSIDPNIRFREGLGQYGLRVPATNLDEKSKNIRHQ